MSNGSTVYFGPYRLLQRIAYGGMAEIFLAEETPNAPHPGRRIAIKRILPQLCTDPHFTHMFADETAIAAQLHHHNIVEIYDAGSIDAIPYIAMEFVDGVDLQQLLHAASTTGSQWFSALPPHVVAYLGYHLTSGLAYAHAACDHTTHQPLDIVHRDVSPHNILLSRTGAIKIADFGIARARARLTHTRTGMIKGKLAYMAPEQAGGQIIDHRADQFSLGVVLWECLAGRRLFTADSEMQMLQHVLACRIPPIDTLCPELSPILSGAIMRALAADPNDRHPDMRAMHDAFAAYLAPTSDHAHLPHDACTTLCKMIALHTHRPMRHASTLSLPNNQPTQHAMRSRSANVMGTIWRNTPSRHDGSTPFSRQRMTHMFGVLMLILATSASIASSHGTREKRAPARKAHATQNRHAAPATSASHAAKDLPPSHTLRIPGPQQTGKETQRRSVGFPPEPQRPHRMTQASYERALLPQMQNHQRTKRPIQW